MKSLLKFIFLLFAASAPAQDLIDSHQQEIVFLSVNIIPMDSDRIVENLTVVVKNGKIISIGEEKKIKYGKDALVIDSKGKYLLPGLAEMHAHVPPVDGLEPMKRVLLLFALNGVTTIRGMLGHPRHLELRSKIANGEIMGPKFYTSGPSFNGQSVKSPAHGEQMVRDQKAAGYDFLKLHPGLSLEKFNAIARTAHELNIPFAGHISFDVGVWRGIDAGYATIDHLDGFVEGMVPEIEHMQEEQTGLFGVFISDRSDTTRYPG